ncbi:MAG: hydroxyethylthiazole kinase [Pseudomonadota bacterium]
MRANAALRALREQSPLIHCMTNFVAMNMAANVLLAAGASPAMVRAPEEVGDFTPLAKALTINIGCLSAEGLAAMKTAAAVARRDGIPWVLDPVAHFATPFRARAARDLLALKPDIVRANASEIIALAGGAASGKGVDAGDAVADAKTAAGSLARAHNCVVAVSGPVDFVTDGARAVEIAGGSDLMPKVTALGCSLTALAGAYAAVAPPFEAAVAACVHFAEAGERAGAWAAGPGSFAVAFLDALHDLSPEDLKEERIACL